MGKFQRSRRKKEAKRIARERMAILYSQAEKAAIQGEEERAKRYVALLRKIGMRYNISIPSSYKSSTCRGCNSFLISGKNARVRLENHNLRVECNGCGRVWRMPYGVERQQGNRKTQNRDGDNRQGRNGQQRTRRN